MKSITGSLTTLMLIFFSACTTTDNEKKTEEIGVEKAGEQQTKTLSDFAGCYQMVIEKDTAYMQLKQDGDRLSGTLTYKRFEKDSNNGTVELKQRKDRLEGWYTFQSEGKTSLKEIVFRSENGALSEGFGDVGMRGDTAIFKYPTTLQFESKHPFNKINCISS